MEEWARAKGTVSNILYRAYPTKRDFSFTFEWTEGSWRIHINTAINYGQRSSSAVQTHRLGLPLGQYICWTDRIETVSGAQAIAALWADSTENYIATGRFEPPRDRPGVVSDISALGGEIPRSPRPNAARATSSPSGPLQSSTASTPMVRAMPIASTARTGQTRWERFLERYFG